VDVVAQTHMKALTLGIYRALLLTSEATRSLFFSLSSEEENFLFFDKFRGGKLNLRRSVYKRPSYCIPFLSFG